MDSQLSTRLLRVSPVDVTLPRLCDDLQFQGEGLARPTLAACVLSDAQGPPANARHTEKSAGKTTPMLSVYLTKGKFLLCLREYGDEHRNNYQDNFSQFSILSPACSYICTRLLVTSYIYRASQITSGIMGFWD